MASTLFDLIAKITLDTKGYESGLSSAESKILNFGKGVSKGVGTIMKGSALAVGAAVTGLTAFAKSSVSAGQSFDSSMSQVAATMGTTVDQIQNLRDFAQEMGATTAFSATQAADALNYMALAGYDSETSMSMLPNVLNLAAAGGMELAAASDMVTDSQSALGLTLDETSELVDKMAKASSKSNTSVSQLGEAILTVGGTAKSLAGGTTELSTALGILADNGVKGSEGGTALRNVILALSAPTDQAKKQLDALGVSVYDNSGNMRDLSTIFGELNTALGSVTQGEKTEILNNLFNKVDLKSANALLDTSADRWKELAGAIDNASGAAKQMANTQLDNLTGDITLFKSALEGVQIAFSDGLTPNVRSFVQIATEGLSAITGDIKEGNWEAVFSTIGDTISKLAFKVVELAPTFVEMAVKMVEALVQGFSENSGLLIDSVFRIANIVIGALPGITGPLIEAGFNVLNALIENLSSPEGLLGLIDAALAIIQQLADGLTQNLPVLIPAVVDIILNLAEKLVDPENITMIMGAATDIMLALIDGIMNSLPDLIARAPELIVQFAMAIINMKVQLYMAGVQILMELITGIGSVFEELTQNGREIVQKVWDGVHQRIEEAKTWGKDLIHNFISGLTAKWEELKQKVAGIAGGIKKFLGFSEPEEGPLSDFHTYAPDMMDLFMKGIDDKTDELRKKVAQSFDFSAMTVSPSIDADAIRTAHADPNADVIAAKIDALTDAILNQHWELDGDVVATRMDERLGATAATKARV